MPPFALFLRRERFRTLTFNLQKSDRVALHKRISSGQVAHTTLSAMSSTELASQEQQQSIKQAEQEALEHSILVKTTVPRAKITHKGLQDIEDVNEDSLVAKQREREAEMAEQERERERLARLRTVQPLSHSHSNPPSASAPPESPVIPSSASGAAPASWGAPHPHPVPPAQSSDFTPAVDPELNLGDFIHMDDEPPESASAPTSPVAPNLPASLGESVAAGQGQGQLGVSTAITGISPFAPSKPDMPPRASFDLNALWSAQSPPPPLSPNEDGKASGEDTDANDDVGGDAMDLDTPPPPVEEVGSRGGEASYEGGPERGGVEHEGDGGDDLDFAMFLGQEEEEKDKEKDKEKETTEPASRPDPQVVFEGLPHVWNGIVSRPLSFLSESVEKDTNPETVFPDRSVCRSTRACRKSSGWSRARSAVAASRPIRRSGGHCSPSTTSGSMVAWLWAARPNICLLRGSTRPRS